MAGASLRHTKAANKMPAIHRLGRIVYPFAAGLGRVLPGPAHARSVDPASRPCICNQGVGGGGGGGMCRLCETRRKDASHTARQKSTYAAHPDRVKGGTCVRARVCGGVEPMHIVLFFKLNIAHAIHKTNHTPVQNPSHRTGEFQGSAGRHPLARLRSLWHPSAPLEPLPRRGNA